MIKRAIPRPIVFTPEINPYALSSVMAEFGQTKVHISVNLSEDVPSWLRGQGKGWITAEYAMLPSATHTRSKRERKGVSGRSQEIQRLIGRGLRSIVDLEKMGELLLHVDCDVLVADGGTRTTSISGAYVALQLAMKKLLANQKISQDPLKAKLAAISVGLTDSGEIIADLNYEEDSKCHTDFNVLMTDSGEYVEVQGTGEQGPFSRSQLDNMLSCAKSAIDEVFVAQRKVLCE